MLRLVLLTWALALFARTAAAEGLSPAALGVVFNRDNPSSVRIARYYAERRGIPAANVIGVSAPDRAVIDRIDFAALMHQVTAQLPAAVQSLLLVWSRPYAVECMSITTAAAIGGYRPASCEPGCRATSPNPLYDTDGWLPADTVGWLPAMLLPSDDEVLARAVIDRGIQADASRPAGSAYLVRTGDGARNARAVAFQTAVERVGRRFVVRVIDTPVDRAPTDILAYFTGVVRVDELPSLRFRPGAAADHLTSYGGMLDGSPQMSALDWLRQGATAAYGTVSEPCAVLAKFPSPAVFLARYLRGDSLLAAYWKSVFMPGQGLFIGEPLARPFAPGRGEVP